MKLQIDRKQLEELCQLHHIRRLSLFGSVLTRSDYRDVDLLVDFDPAHVPGFLQLHEITEDFSRLFGGKPIDLVTEKALHPRIRDEVLGQARVEYAQ